MTTHKLEYRTAETIAVSFPKRLIEVVVMPYDKETVVEYRGRMIRESVAPGAFDGIANRPNRVNVNRDHDVTRHIGKAVSFHPARPEGLVAELKIANIPLGDQTLELAKEGMLDASAAFAPIEHRDGTPGEDWPERNRRRLTRVWLGHIAMTPEPAYPEAKVLSVRDTVTTTETDSGVVVVTPNLDRARALRAEDLYSSLSR